MTRTRELPVQNSAMDKVKKYWVKTALLPLLAEWKAIQHRI